MNTKKIVTWIAVIAIIISFIAPLALSLFDSGTEPSIEVETLSGTQTK